jgi:hypothetical protein
LRDATQCEYRASTAAESFVFPKLKKIVAPALYKVPQLVGFRGTAIAATVLFPNTTRAKLRATGEQWEEQNANDYIDNFDEMIWKFNVMCDVRDCYRIADDTIISQYPSEGSYAEAGTAITVTYKDARDQREIG